MNVGYVVHVTTVVTLKCKAGLTNVKGCHQADVWHTSAGWQLQSTWQLTVTEQRSPLTFSPPTAHHAPLIAWSSLRTCDQLFVEALKLRTRPDAEDVGQSVTGGVGASVEETAASDCGSNPGSRHGQ